MPRRAAIARRESRRRDPFRFRVSARTWYFGRSNCPAHHIVRPFAGDCWRTMERGGARGARAASGQTRSVVSMSESIEHPTRQLEYLHARQASAWVQILLDPTTDQRAAFVKWLKDSPRNVRDFLHAGATPGNRAIQRPGGRPPLESGDSYSGSKRSTASSRNSTAITPDRCVWKAPASRAACLPESSMPTMQTRWPRCWRGIPALSVSYSDHVIVVNAR